MLADLALSSIADARARELVQRLRNVLEGVMADLRAAQAENQRLRDEINRLKGEQGAPAIKPNTPLPPPKHHSSEKERRQPKIWSKDRQTDRIAIDREQVAQVDPTHLPLDAVFKGDEDVVGQDVIFRTDHVLCHKEKFSSPSQPQTSLASLPQGYHGQCGPGIKSLALECPVVRLLICDDAPQCTVVTEELALCWVHAGRHDKKLVPYVPLHRTLTEAFVPRFWTYDDAVLA